MEQRSRQRRNRLLERMPKGGVCVEIGVWTGDFSARILEVTEPRLLHLVDPWRYEASEAYAGAWYAGGRAKNQADMDDVHAGVIERFAKEIGDGRIAVHRAPSVDAAARFDDGSLDWIYVDGNHFYEFVKLDLAVWGPKIRSGGFMAGDDYGSGGWWKGGVKQAVDEFCAGNGVGLSLIGRQFVIRIP